MRWASNQPPNDLFALFLWLHPPLISDTTHLVQKAPRLLLGGGGGVQLPPNDLFARFL